MPPIPLAVTRVGRYRHTTPQFGEDAVGEGASVDLAPRLNMRLNQAVKYLHLLAALPVFVVAVRRLQAAELDFDPRVLSRLKFVKHDTLGGAQRELHDGWLEDVRCQQVTEVVPRPLQRDGTFFFPVRHVKRTVKRRILDMPRHMPDSHDLTSLLVVVMG